MPCVKACRQEGNICRVFETTVGQESRYVNNRIEEIRVEDEIPAVGRGGQRDLANCVTESFVQVHFFQALELVTVFDKAVEQLVDDGSQQLVPSSGVTSRTQCINARIDEQSTARKVIPPRRNCSFIPAI